MKETFQVYFTTSVQTNIAYDMNVSLSGDIFENALVRIALILYPVQYTTILMRHARQCSARYNKYLNCSTACQCNISRHNTVYEFLKFR